MRLRRMAGGLTLRAEADAWAYVRGAQVKCVLEIMFAPHSSGKQADGIWVDWISAQLCGFCTQHSQGADHSGLEGGVVPPENLDNRLGLPDQLDSTGPPRVCILGSCPTVVVRRLRLGPGDSGRFVVTAQLPDAELPPSFTGAHISYEYKLAVALRTMSPPQRSGWYFSGGSQEWDRGPICTLDLPLRVLFSSPAQPEGMLSQSPLSPWRPELQCYSEPQSDGGGHGNESTGWELVGGPTWSMVGRAGCRGGSDGAVVAVGNDNEEEEEDDESDDDRTLGGGCSFQIDGGEEMGGRLATVWLERGACRAGGALGGNIAFSAVGACTRVILKLVLEEHVAGAIGESRDHECALLLLPAAQLIQSAFEMPVPLERPPTLRIGVLELRWALVFRFELRATDGNSTGSPISRVLESRLPVRVLPAHAQGGAVPEVPAFAPRPREALRAPTLSSSATSIFGFT